MNARSAPTGPPCAMMRPELRNSPVPMVPASAIICMCRCSMRRCTPSTAVRPGARGLTQLRVHVGFHIALLELALVLVVLGLLDRLLDRLDV